MLSSLYEEFEKLVQSQFIKYTDEYGITYNIPKNVKFRMHANDSFFEVYARENVYQLFDYSMMKYMKYEITLPEDEKHEVKIEDKKDNYKLEEMDINNLQYTVAKNDEDNKFGIIQKRF